MPKVYPVECVAYSSGVEEFYRFYIKKWSDLPARAPGRLALLGWRASLQWQAGATH